MADVYNAAFHGETAEVRQLIDRGGNVNWKDVRRRLCRAPAPASSPRARALRQKEPAASAHGASCAPSLERVPAALPTTFLPFRPPPLFAKADAKRVSAHRAPSLERVPAAPPPPPSLPLPSPLAPPAADGSPLVGSGPIRRRTDTPLSTSPQRKGTRRPSRRSSPPRRKWTPSW